MSCVRSVCRVRTCSCVFRRFAFLDIISFFELKMLSKHTGALRTGHAPHTASHIEVPSYERAGVYVRPSQGAAQPARIKPDGWTPIQIQTCPPACGTSPIARHVSHNRCHTPSDTVPSTRIVLALSTLGFADTATRARYTMAYTDMPAMSPN